MPSIGVLIVRLTDIRQDLRRFLIRRLLWGVKIVGEFLQIL